MLAAGALSATEYTKGYSTFQWCYGKDYVISNEDVRTFQCISSSENGMSFEALVCARQEAEQVARRTRALRVMSRLKNSSVRQPLRTFRPMDLVKVWRKQWPSHLYTGKRGGSQVSGKPHWVGPGRVIFHEVLPHQEHDDDRRHIVWVLLGKHLLRCSVHSVRPVTELEKAYYDVTNKEDPTRWKSLSDLLPHRQYEDLTDQVPGADEIKEVDLPDAPDAETAPVPFRRVHEKRAVPASEMIPHSLQRRLQEAREAGLDTDDVNDYEPSPATPSEDDGAPRLAGTVLTVSLSHPSLFPSDFGERRMTSH